MTENHPEENELRFALRWLRQERLRITQAELVERVRAQGEPLSLVYYKKIEGGERQPAPEKLEAILAALGSDREELSGLLGHRPWTALGEEFGRRVRSFPPAAYAEAADASLRSAGTWSSEIEIDDAETVKLRAELAELEQHFRLLSLRDRAKLLEQARRLRFKR